MAGTLTDFYKMRMTARQKGGCRFDCEKSTNSYEPFEGVKYKSRTGRFFFRLNVSPDELLKGHWPPIKVITSFNRILARLYVVTDYNRPANHSCAGFGVVKGTRDLLLFRYKPGIQEMEISIARGRLGDWTEICSQFIAGKLGWRIVELRNAATVPPVHVRHYRKHTTRQNDNGR